QRKAVPQHRQAQERYRKAVGNHMRGSRARGHAWTSEAPSSCRRELGQKLVEFLRRAECMHLHRCVLREPATEFRSFQPSPGDQPPPKIPVFSAPSEGSPQAKPPRDIEE